MGSAGTDDREDMAMTDGGGAEGDATAGDATELGRVRDLVLQAHPDVVPDLVRGATLDELLASVEPARSAYQQVAEQVRSRNGAAQEPAAGAAPAPTPAPPSVPAGGTATVVDPATLSPTTKIAQALAERRRA
jgi:hypothetical protein